MDTLSLLTARRRLLSERIANQRILLHQSYERLEPTIRYVGYGVDTVQFIRRSPLSLILGSGALSFVAGKIVRRLFGFESKKQEKIKNSEVVTEPKPQNKKEFLVRLAKQAWQAYQLYRHFRAHLP